MNPKFEKLLAKAGVSIVFALMLGYVYKQELKIEDQIDKKYEKKDSKETS